MKMSNITTREVLNSFIIFSVAQMQEQDET